MELIINVMALFVGIALWMYGRYWRKTCGKVLCQYAAACGEREDREKLMRYAIIAGNPHAPLLYALTYPELFDKARPLRLFAFGEIRCVFAGYYFPQRFESWLCDDQSAFVQEVYDFKDGKDDCTEYFLRHSGFFPPTGMLRLCSCHAALPTVITDVFPALPVFGNSWLCPVRTGPDMYYRKQGVQAYFRKTFRNKYRQLYDVKRPVWEEGRDCR